MKRNTRRTAVEHGRRWFDRLRHAGYATGVAMVMLVSTLSGSAASAAVDWESPEELMASVKDAETAKEPRVRVSKVGATTGGVTGTRPGAGESKKAWPAGTASRQVTVTDRARVVAGGLPVTVAGAGGDVNVTVAGRAATRRAGVEGVVFTLAPTAGDPGEQAAARTPAAEGVRVSVDVSEFRDAIGGDWASRARLVLLPDCGSVKTADAVNQGCAAEAVPLTGGTSDGTTVAGTVAATDAAALTSSSGSPMVMALTAGASGGAGSFAATSLSPSAAWSAGSGTGEFSWQYPVDVPDAQAGPAPEVTIGYSSAMVDGRTASTNNQASWVGDGFNLDLGYVERRYVSCSDDTAAVGGQNPNNTNRKTGDLCWGPDSVTLSLDGTTTDLVHDTATGAWIPKDDDQTRVQLLTGDTCNGDNNGEYWVVTTDDGTKYYFGRQTRGTGDTAALNATQTVPVYGNHPGEQCYASTFSTAWCQQAYRWNLAYVVDVNGNSMSLFYDKEMNHYNRNLGSTANTGTGMGTGQITPYVRAAKVNRVEYGTRDGVWTGKAPFAVSFTTAERCIPDAGFTCDPSLLTAANASRWPDVPFDQICSATACSGKYSPAFFSRLRLTGIATRTVDAGGADRPVDSFAFAQTMADPGDGTSKALWLDSITRTGHAASPAISTPPVTFTGVPLDNRVDAIGDNAPPLRRWRVTSVVSGTGSTVAVTYSGHDCTPTSKPAAPESNTRRCFPSYYQPEWSTAGNPVIHYFHKYLVTQVTETDNTGGSPQKITRYEYVGDPAWHYDDNVLTPVKYRTWGDWRGYGQVITRVGADGVEKLKTSNLFLRGMHGDKLPTGTRTVTVTDSQGGTITDEAWLAGFPRESITHVGDTATVNTSEITSPWVSAPTATDTTLGVAARRVEEGQSTTRTKITGGWRTTRSTTSYDAYGRDVQVWDEGDLATTTDDICTTSTYTQNTTAWIWDTPATAIAVAKPCGVTPSFPADLVTGTQMYYDGATSLTAAPSKGQVTKETEADAYSGGAWTYTTVSESSYDSLGRLATAKDPLGRTTSTAYTPATALPVTKVVTTNPAGHTETTNVTPGVGITSEVDANGNTTTAAYDALGRVTKVWAPDRSTTLSPNVTYAYTLSGTAPNTVTTQSLVSVGSYATTVELYDGMLRPRQSQTQISSKAGGGRMISTTEYDSRGLTPRALGPFPATGAPAGTLVTPASMGDVPTSSVYTYDGLGRLTLDTLQVNGVDKWSTSTIYTGDTTTSVPPAGGTTTTSVVDAMGRTTAFRQHTAGPGSSYDQTTYTYTPGGQIATVTDPAGNTWTTTYDIHGRVTSKTDPDQGTSTSTYDQGDQVVTSTDGRGTTLWHGYDVLGRPTEVRDNTSTGTLLTSFTYDTATLGKGLPATSTRHYSGNQYTSSVTGYTPTGQPTGSSVTIPANEGALAGTYTTAMTYSPSGMPGLYTPATVPGLPTDTQRFGYDDVDQVGSLSTLDHGSIVPGVVYNAYGEPTKMVLGNLSGKLTTATYAYEIGTHRMTGTTIARQAAAGAFDADITYTYNPAGAITAITDTKFGATGDQQCFQFDYLQRLTQSWTQTGTGGTCAASPSTGILGGPAPSWTTYAYDKTGNRTSEVKHATTTGGTDTVRTYSYRNPSGAGANSGPHQLTSLAQTGPGGPSTETTGYDNAGNTTTRTSAAGTQTFTYNSENDLTTVTGPGASSYLYDAGGERLIRRDPTAGVTTLYLGDTEIALATATGVKTSTRYYSLGGSQVAVRTSSGVTSVVTDHHNTGTFEVDNATGALAAVRRLDPFGVNRSSGSTGTWLGSKGFVGGTIDPTGFTQLGARAYHPATGRFLTLDPVMSPDDPQQLNGYAYANNNPINQADPDGLLSWSAAKNWAKKKAAAAAARWRAIKAAAAARLAAIKAAAARAKAAAAAAAAKVAATAARVKATVSARAKAGAKRAVQAGKKVVTSAKRTVSSVKQSAVSKGKSAKNALGSPNVKQLAEWGANCSGGEGAGACMANQFLYNSKDAQGNRITPTASDIKSYNTGVGFAASFAVPGGPALGGIGTMAKAGFAGAKAARGEKLLTTAGKACSFAGATPVLMADGTRKPIQDVHIGDKVIATDPETGEQQAKPVEHVFVHDDTVLDLTLANGNIITTTEDHPFWSHTDRQFKRADQLTFGEYVLTADGHMVTVTGLQSGTVRKALAYNLSVDGIHTYHVGQSNILVHNLCEDAVNMTHIKDKHTWGGSERTATSGVWDHGVDLQPLIKQSTGTIGRRNNRGDIEYRVTTNSVVGKAKGSGIPTNRYMVVRDPNDGYVVTMYPIK